jgi:hypothetical protein
MMSTIYKHVVHAAWTLETRAKKTLKKRKESSAQKVFYSPSHKPNYGILARAGRY